LLALALLYNLILVYAEVTTKLFFRITNSHKKYL